MSGYRWLWVGWFGVFLVLEFNAIIRRRYQDTLSEFAWWMCGITPGHTSWHWNAVHLLVTFGLLWLLFHISLGWFR